MLAAVLSEQRQAGFLLSEHGIYVRERLEEMRRADWIRDQQPRRAELLQNFGKLKSLWMILFCEQAALAYGSADKITSLFGAQRQYPRGVRSPSRKNLDRPERCQPRVARLPSPRSGAQAQA